MDTNKMREQFEAWVLREWPEQSLARFTSGEYQGFTVDHCWQAWVASRADLVKGIPQASDFAASDSPAYVVEALVEHIQGQRKETAV